MSRRTSPKIIEDSTSDDALLPWDVIIHLGLDKTDPEHHSGRAPCVLAYFCSALERAIQKNERALEVGRRKDSSITIFHSSRPPSLSIRQYLDRIFRYAPCSPSCFVAAQIYIDRFRQRTGSLLTSLNIHRLLITSIVVASKFMDDVGHNNAHYAKVGGVSTEEMNNLEMKFLFSIDFRVHITVDIFVQYCKQLEREAYQGNQSIKACKVRERIPDKQVQNRHSRAAQL